VHDRFDGQVIYFPHDGGHSAGGARLSPASRHGSMTPRASLVEGQCRRGPVVPKRLVLRAAPPNHYLAYHLSVAPAASLHFRRPMLAGAPARGGPPRRRIRFGPVALFQSEHLERALPRFALPRLRPEAAPPPDLRFVVPRWVAGDRPRATRSWRCGASRPPMILLHHIIRCVDSPLLHQDTILLT